jgi:hypothetical protein
MSSDPVQIIGAYISPYARAVLTMLQLKADRRPFEDLSVRRAIGRHRAALRAVDAPISTETYGTPLPRPGILQI